MLPPCTTNRPPPATPHDPVASPLFPDQGSPQPIQPSGNQAESHGATVLAEAHITRCSDRCEKYLCLGNLSLTSLPPVIWHMQQLRQLHVGCNLLKTIPAEISSLRQLTHLSAGGNEIEEISAALGCLTQLEVLDLSDNQLTSLPAELANLRSLRYLYIRGNPFHQPPPVLASLPETCSVLISPVQGGTKLEHRSQLANPDGSGLGPVIMIDDKPDRFWLNPKCLA